MSKKDLVRQWKEEAAKRRAKRAAEVVSVSVNFAGFPGKAHRLFLLDWAKAERMPQYLSAAMFAAVKGQSTEVKKSEISPEELAETLRFQCHAFCSMMDEPRFSTDEMRGGRELADDEMDYAEFVTDCPEVVREAVEWQLNGCPDIPVQTESGEVALDDLKKFRSRRKRTSSAKPGNGMPGVWWKTQPTPRHIM